MYFEKLALQWGYVGGDHEAKANVRIEKLWLTYMSAEEVSFVALGLFCHYKAVWLGSRGLALWRGQFFVLLIDDSCFSKNSRKEFGLSFIVFSVAVSREVNCKG